MKRTANSPRPCPSCKAENLPNALVCVSCGIVLANAAQLAVARAANDSDAPVAVASEATTEWIAPASFDGPPPPVATFAEPGAIEPGSTDPAITSSATGWVATPARTWILVAGVVVLALSALLAFRAFAGGPDIVLPPEVGGHPLITTPGGASIRAYGNPPPLGDAVVGAYGIGEIPTLVVAVMERPGGWDRLETEWIQAVGSTTGMIIDDGARLHVSRDGVDFICAPVASAAPPLSGSMCMWDDGDTIGWVMNIEDSSPAVTLGIAEIAYAAAVRG